MFIRSDELTIKVEWKVSLMQGCYTNSWVEQKAATQKHMRTVASLKCGSLSLFPKKTTRMDFGSFDLESNNNNILKSPYALPTSTAAAQQHDNTQQHTTSHANVDFYSFTQHDFNSMALDLPSHAFDSYNVPQLTPDGRDQSNCTNSSVLTGQNPDYTMSPLQISTSNHGQHQQTISLEDMTNFNDDEVSNYMSRWMEWDRNF